MVAGCCLGFDMTTVKKGDWLRSFGDDKILLYDHEWPGKPSQCYQSKHFGWVIHGCRLFNYAKESKNQKLIQIFVDLIEKNHPEYLCCQNLILLLKKAKIGIPYYDHCSDCPNLTIRASGKLKASQ